MTRDTKHASSHKDARVSICAYVVLIATCTSSANASLILDWSDDANVLTGNVHVNTSHPEFMMNGQLTLANGGILSISFTHSITGNTWISGVDDYSPASLIDLPADPNDVSMYQFVANANDDMAPLGNNSPLALNGVNGSISGGASISIITGGTFTASAVPEPSTVGLALVGVIGLATVTWRRRRGRAS